MIRFQVSFEIVTPESAELGDAESRGFADTEMTLRDAIDSLFETRTSRVDGVQCIEPNSSPFDGTGVNRWITVCNGMEFETGATESRSLHIPPNVTAASARRIAQLIGVTK